MVGKKKVFISYSWAVQERVIELAERLIANGVDVVLDVYDLKEGHDKYAFMEQSVNDPSIDRVLIICDKTYTEKADDRSGGVGDETVIISPEVYKSVQQEKFIPVAFEVDEDNNAYIPAYLKARIYIDLTTEDDHYEVEYEKLLRNIYEKPLYKKPALGVAPAWLEDDAVDLSAVRDLVKQVRGYSGANTAKADFLLRKAGDAFVIAAKQFVLPGKQQKSEELLAAIDHTKGYRDLFIEFCESLIYSSLPIQDSIATLFESLYNELHSDKLDVTLGTPDLELYDFMLWELFISMTATLLHYEKYSELHSLLIRPYFLRRYRSENGVEPQSYCFFRRYMRTIEEVCKPQSAQSRLYTLTGEILVHREKKPILTKESLSNADLVLYQLGKLFVPLNWNRGKWFPTTYIYHSEVQNIWKRLVSTSYCVKISPLFGVNSIPELKQLIAKSTTDENMRYNGAWDPAPGILYSITLDSIATLP